MKKSKALEIARPKFLVPKALSPTDRAFVEAALTLKLQGCTWEDMSEELAKAGFLSQNGTPYERSNLVKRIRPYYLMVQDTELFEVLKNITLMTAIEATQQAHDALAAGEVSKQSLGVWAGIFSDKVTKQAMVSKKEEESPKNPIMDMLAKIAASGGSLKLEVSQPKTMDVKAVDVEVVE